MGDGPLATTRSEMARGKLKFEFQWEGPAGNSLILTASFVKAKAGWTLKDASSENLH